jgi:hypothetical protein
VKILHCLHQDIFLNGEFYIFSRSLILSTCLRNDFKMNIFLNSLWYVNSIVHKLYEKYICNDLSWFLNVLLSIWMYSILTFSYLEIYLILINLFHHQNTLFSPRYYHYHLNHMLIDQEKKLKCLLKWYGSKDMSYTSSDIFGINLYDIWGF